jgi:hypothetical protein
MDTTTTTNGRKILREMYRSDDYKRDPWGTAIQLLFAVCDVLSTIDPEAIEDRWEFRHGQHLDPSLQEMADSDDYPTCELAPYVISDQVNAEDLRRFGNVLSRLADIAKAHGHSY